MRFKATCGLINLTPIVSCFHHQWHETNCDRPSNELRENKELEFLNTRVNDENWGLGDTELEEE